MLFNRKLHKLQREQEAYWACKRFWYFRVEYFVGMASATSFMYFDSIHDAEYWYKNTRCVSLLALTDRQGNRIITDWTGMSGVGTIKLWTDMGRQVLDLRNGHNDLWVPSDSKRAKEAKT